MNATPAATLQAEIDRYVGRGYRVVSQTEHAAQLVRPKHFSFPLFVLFFILAVLPAVLYVLYYVGKRDKTVYLTVNDNGQIQRR